MRCDSPPDSAAALAAVKAALGPEAILISTWTVQGGIFRRPEVEVTAAAGDAIEPTATPAPTAPPTRAPAPALSAYLSSGAATRPIDDPLASEVQLLRRSVEETRRALATVRPRMGLARLALAERPVAPEPRLLEELQVPRRRRRRGRSSSRRAIQRRC